MDLRPGALLGLPPGVPSVVLDVAYWRDLLVLVALASGWSMARGRERGALAFAIAWALLAVSFWTAALGRPYGVLLDPATTRWAADVSVAAHAGGDDGFLSGEPTGHAAWSGAGRRVGAAPLLLAPTLAAALVLPAIALLVALLWKHPDSRLAAILWMAASTLDIDVVRGTALVPALWPAPATGAALALGVAVLLVAARRARGRAAAVLGLAVAGSLASMVAPSAAFGPAELPGALLFDALPWVALGALGLRRAKDPAAIGLVAGGAAALVLAAVGLGDAVAAAGFYRAGLVLAAAPLVARGAFRLGGLLRVPLPGGGAWSPDGAAWRGVAVGVLLAGSFLTWWDPPRTDALARDSLKPVPGVVAETMEWIRTRTDPRGVFVSGEDYAAEVAVLGGRRVLRAPTLVTPADDLRRLRASRAVLSARRTGDGVVQRYGVRYVFLATGEFRDHRLDEPWPIESSGAVLLYQNASGLRVCEIPAEGAR